MHQTIAVIAKQTPLFAIIGRISNYNMIYTSSNKDDALMESDR